MIIRRLIVPLLAFTFFLVTGLWIGNQVGNTVKYSHSLAGEKDLGARADENANPLTNSNALISPRDALPLPDSEINRFKAPQRNILVVAVDEIGAERPRLEGVWLILYLPDLPHVTLMPVYPEVITDGHTLIVKADEELAGEFDLTPDKVPSPAFFESVAAKNIWWNNYLLLEKSTLEKLVDSMGGMENTNHNSHEALAEYSGSQAVDMLTSTQVDPQAGLLSQAQFAQRMCRKNSQPLFSAGNLRFTYSLLKEHIITDLRPEQIVADLEGMLQRRGGISCEFPSLALVSTKR